MAMREISPNAVAAHYATCTALAFSAVALPFLPEVVLLYAGIHYLRGFLYGARQWRAPARVPLTLGRRGYRDATTRKRGEATWPVGTADGRQVWLLRQDLTQGCAFQGNDPDWQAEAIERLVFGACLNRMGALVIQDYRTPRLFPDLARVASSFGRDAEIATIDLADPLTTPLRITVEAIAAALADRSISDAAQALVTAVVPVLLLTGRRSGDDPLVHFRVFLELEALQALADGRGDLERITAEADDVRSADIEVLHEALAALRAIPYERLVVAQKELAPFARELVTMPGLSLTRGLDLVSVLTARRLTCIRPASAWSAALIIETCNAAIGRFPPGTGAECLIHVAYPADEPSCDRGLKFLKESARAGAIGSIALSCPRDPSSFAPIRAACSLRFERRDADRSLETVVESSLKDCRFSLSILPFDVGLKSVRVTEKGA